MGTGLHATCGQRTDHQTDVTHPLTRAVRRAFGPSCRCLAAARHGAWTSVLASSGRGGCGPDAAGNVLLTPSTNLSL